MRDRGSARSEDGELGVAAEVRVVAVAVPAGEAEAPAGEEDHATVEMLHVVPAVGHVEGEQVVFGVVLGSGVSATLNGSGGGDVGFDG